MIPQLLITVAQTTQPGGGAAPGGGLFSNNIVILLIFFMVFFYLFMFRGQSKKQKELAKMIQELKKNDRVQTIGGIIGTVVSTKGDEVTLRVDESNNTKLTLVRKAIQHVLTDQSQPQGQ